MSSLKIVVFEHETIRVGQRFKDVEFQPKHFHALEKFHSASAGKYYALGHQRITFCEYVGVLQIGNLTIEILPKSDLHLGELTKSTWRNLLISMLRKAGYFDIYAPTSSSLKIQSNSLLDLYFKLYIHEIEYLLHQGIIKKYRRSEGNNNSLKGTLLFNKQIQHNLIHQEKFYTRFTTYDVHHLLHCILYKAILLLKKINVNPSLQSHIGSLLLHFPEMADIKISQKTLDKVSFNRKTFHYQNAFRIARLLLLNYHPDISRGGNHVLALMFDMNVLWEKFVTVTLKNHFQKGTTVVNVKRQVSKSFWQPKEGQTTKIRPDIVLEIPDNKIVVIDAKWKNLNGINPSLEDLRQLYVYHHYFKAEKVAIIYPGASVNRPGIYHKTDANDFEKECSLIGLEPEGDIQQWQEQIYQKVNEWIGCTKLK